MEDKKLYDEILKLEIKVSDLKRIVLGQCVTILSLLDENREIKKLIKEEAITNDINRGNVSIDCMMSDVVDMYEHEDLFLKKR